MRNYDRNKGLTHLKSIELHGKYEEGPLSPKQKQSVKSYPTKNFNELGSDTEDPNANELEVMKIRLKDYTSNKHEPHRASLNLDEKRKIYEEYALKYSSIMERIDGDRRKPGSTSDDEEGKDLREGSTRLPKLNGQRKIGKSPYLQNIAILLSPKPKRKVDREREKLKQNNVVYRL